MATIRIVWPTTRACAWRHIDVALDSHIREARLAA
jgi:hypothetical protein